MLITNLLPFLIEKVISSNMNPIHIKKLKNQTLLVEVDKRKNADFLLKMTKFHTINVKTYPHKSLNISKGVVRSKELSLCSIKEIKKEMKKQGVTEVKRVTIKKEGKLIETNTYIMTFDQPKIPKKIKVGYTMERVEQFIPNPLRCYNCQKYDKYVANELNKILTTTATIVTICIGVQIAGAIILSMQDPVRVGNWKRKYWELNTGITSHTTKRRKW